MELYKLKGLGLGQTAVHVTQTFIRHGFTVLSGVCFIILVARYLGPDGNGLYSMSILLPSLLATMLSLGVTSANVYFLGGGRVSFKTALLANYKIWFVICVFGLGCAAIMLFFFHETIFPGVALPLLWTALSCFPLIVLHSFLASLLQGIEDFKKYNFVLMVGPVVTLVTALFFMQYIGMGVMGALFAFICGHGLSLLAVVLGLADHRRKEKGSVAVGEVNRYIVKCLGYGWKAHLGNILAFVNYRIDVFLVNLMISPEAVGIYVVAVKIVEQIWLLSKSASVVLLPKLSGYHDEEEKRKVLTLLVSRWVLMISLLMSMVLAMLVQEIVLLLFGQNYHEAAGVLLWLLPGVVIGSMARVLANDIAARGRPELNLYSSAVIVITNVIANIILIPTFGLSGAAMATTLAYTLNTGIKVLIFCKLSSCKWWETFFPCKEDMIIIRHLLKMKSA